MYVFVVHLCVYMCACMCVYVCVYVFVCMCVYILHTKSLRSGFDCLRDISFSGWASCALQACTAICYLLHRLSTGQPSSFLVSVHKKTKKKTKKKKLGIFSKCDCLSHLWASKCLLLNMLT